MQFDLSGLKAIVTGSTAGIGFATARGLAVAGAQVVINGRKQDACEKAAEALRKAAPKAKIEAFVGDLSTSEGCDALVSAHPACDILVNNVGIFGPKDFFETPDDIWEQYFHINVMSGVRLSRAYLKGMENKKWGRVIFISSESAQNIPQDMIHYGFSKTAQLAVSRGLAKRMAGTGVTVNSVLPGPTMSEGVKTMLEQEAEKTGKSVDEISRGFVMQNRPSSLIQRFATVEEVANMVLYVASRESSATSGAALRVEGGILETIF
ncbi:SDR family NAD(P)-dependent oxidoreductase [Acetobacter senegalensis]|uniref:SDR family NAD(P)-dependent oxidoreductase n=1 Tax=Acetobacter senegalensis TaxID=446692 RepID=UPI0026541915|nr:SDR family oxidoreductase [Acetobacter senegalensis]MDN7355342.1 SDR family oxidoreductase [Acetobacter senegalensis]